MKRLLTGLLGLMLVAAGAFLLHKGEPDEGPYRYPAEARQEARDFARTIDDPGARERFLRETTGRTKIEHPLEVFGGGVSMTLGIALGLIALRAPDRKNPASLRRAA